MQILRRRWAGPEGTGRLPVGAHRCATRRTGPHRRLREVSVVGLKPPLPPVAYPQCTAGGLRSSQTDRCNCRRFHFTRRSASRKHSRKLCSSYRLVMSGSRDLPAIEDSGMGGMRLPIGMTRRALSYDDNLEAPMSTPPHDISINNLWRRPVIPERRFSHLAEEDESGAVSQSTVRGSAPSRSPTVVKAKASSVIMNSLITKQTQDSVYRFEQKAGLTDTSYTPHKGLTAEETRLHHRMPESLQKLQIQSLEAREDRQSSSTQSTPSNTPHSSPKQLRRGWFSSTGSEVSVSSSNSSVDLGGADSAVERWSVFGPRPLVQKSTSDLGSDPTASAGFALQAYRGAHKPTPMEVMKSQATRLADNTADQKANPPKMEIPTVEGRRQGARPHKLKPRDMNVLTPSGF